LSILLHPDRIINPKRVNDEMHMHEVSNKTGASKCSVKFTRSRMQMCECKMNWLTIVCLKIGYEIKKGLATIPKFSLNLKLRFKVIVMISTDIWCFTAALSSFATVNVNVESKHLFTNDVSHITTSQDLVPFCWRS
jgi:hypothetical protein